MPQIKGKRMGLQIGPLGTNRVKLSRFYAQYCTTKGNKIMEASFYSLILVNKFNLILIEDFYLIDKQNGSTISL